MFRIGLVDSEIRGGGARNSPSSGARYKNTPVGRGVNLQKVGPGIPKRER